MDDHPRQVLPHCAAGRGVVTVRADHDVETATTSAARKAMPRWTTLFAKHQTPGKLAFVTGVGLGGDADAAAAAAAVDDDADA